MAHRIDSRGDLILLLLYSPGRSDIVNEPIIGKTRLIKMLFLFKEEVLAHFKKGTDITAENFYEFFPWDFGPFSSQVYDDIAFFTLRGFVEQRDAAEDALPESAAEWEEWLSMSRADSDEEPVAEYDEEEFRLSERGLRFATQLYDSLSLEQRRLLQAFKSRTGTAPLRALLKYVYENYPDQTTRSKIKEKIIGQ